MEQETKTIGVMRQDIVSEDGKQKNFGVKILKTTDVERLYEEIRMLQDGLYILEHSVLSGDTGLVEKINRKHTFLTAIRMFLIALTSDSQKIDDCFDSVLVLFPSDFMERYNYYTKDGGRKLLEYHANPISSST